MTSRLGLRRKTLLGIAEERGGRRGAGNAIANTGVAAVAAVLAAITPHARAGALAFVAALTAGGSDTVASEIGKALGRRTFLVHTARARAAGTPGAMSLEGTAAGLVGALALGSLGVAARARPGVGARRDRRRRDRSERSPRACSAPRSKHRGILNNDVLNFLNTGDRGGDGDRRWRDGVGEQPRRPAVSSSRGRSRSSRRRSAVVSGAVTAAGAAPREPWSAGPDRLSRAWGLLMAAVLNAANNALNQIYDLEIDRINKPARPLPSGRLSIARRLDVHAAITYAIALVLAWLVAPGGRHECFWIVARRHRRDVRLLRARRFAPSGAASGPTSRSRSRAACC